MKALCLFSFQTLKLRWIIDSAFLPGHEVTIHSYSRSTSNIGSMRGKSGIWYWSPQISSSCRYRNAIFVTRSIIFEYDLSIWWFSVFLMSWVHGIVWSEIYLIAETLNKLKSRGRHHFDLSKTATMRNLPALVREKFKVAQAAGDITFFQTQCAILQYTSVPVRSQDQYPSCEKRTDSTIVTVPIALFSCFGT